MASISQGFQQQAGPPTKHPFRKVFMLNHDRIDASLDVFSQHPLL
ncbi:MAG: hypothetical protein NTV43_02330 [Methylococcales bacterium]|nr:hypothetical protein [Methylococcales bacterium]